MNFGAHKLLISGSGNQRSSIGANTVACCAFFKGYRRKTYGVAVFFVLVFFPLPQFWLLVLPKTVAPTGWGLSGPSCVVFVLSDLKNVSGSASPASHATESSWGSLPPSRLPAGRLRLSRVTPFVLFPSVARHFPLANRISLVLAGAVSLSSQVYSREGRGFYCQVLRVAS